MELILYEGAIAPALAAVAALPRVWAQPMFWACEALKRSPTAIVLTKVEAQTALVLALVLVPVEIAVMQVLVVVESVTRVATSRASVTSLLALPRLPAAVLEPPTNSTNQQHLPLALSMHFPASLVDFDCQP